MALHQTKTIMARKHNEDEVLYRLRKKHDVRVTQNKEILVLSRKSKQKQHDLGNGSWGKIDFLVNHCGYRQIFVSDF